MRFAYLIEPPFNFVGAQDGRVTGCDVELARHVVGALGEGAFEPVETEFPALLPGLAQGRWAMTTGMFATPARRARARFSRPIWALPDGLLVQRGNPSEITGYGALAARTGARLAVIRDQFQHATALDLGVPAERIDVFETYLEAARAVRDGAVAAYASVGRAHGGFMARQPDWPLELVEVPASEKPPAFGCFAFAADDAARQGAVDEVLRDVLGSAAHRAMMAGFGFSDAEVDLILGSGPINPTASAPKNA